MQFDDETILSLFGADAAEDEDTQKLKAFFFRNKAYQNIRANIPLRILVGHKGIGKSALLKMSYIEDIEEKTLAIWLQPSDLISREGEKRISILEKIDWYKKHILDLVWHKSLESLGSQNSSVSGKIFNSAGSILSSIIQHISKENNIDLSIPTRKLRENFQINTKIRIYIDDIDRGWQATVENINDISALVNAARDLSNEEKRIQFRIGLRTDAYYLFRTSDESTDKVEGNVVRLAWTDHDILVVMSTRVANFFGKHVTAEDLSQLDQMKIAKELHQVIEERFKGRGHWENAPIHRVIISLVRKRPRDIIKLLSGAAKEAYRKDHNKITTGDLENTFENYSHERMQDIILEFRSELPDVEKLVYNMRPTEKRIKNSPKGSFLYKNDELLAKITNIMSNHNFYFTNKKLVSPKSLAEFLYKIDFIVARGEDRFGNRTWTHFDQNRMLQSQFVDFGYQWEVHPAYRWALAPKRISDIFDDIDPNRSE